MNDRERIWKLLFKDKPMPEQKEGAVDEMFGMLSDKYGKFTEEEFDELLREAKGKIVRSCVTDEEED